MRIGDTEQIKTPTRPALSPTAITVLSGVNRYFAEAGWACLNEFSLPNKRRADIMALGSNGELVIIEVKSCLGDFTSDSKWHEYQGFCDRFYFAVDENFPMTVIPEECGLIAADAFSSEIIRTATTEKLHASRRKSLTLLFALTAARRLNKAVQIKAAKPQR